MTENEAKLILDVRISRFDHADDVNEALNVAGKALETVQKVPKVIEELEKMIDKCHSEMKELENNMYSGHIFDECHYQAIAYNEAVRIIKERLETE